MGRTIHCSNYYLKSCNEPISFQVTSGITAKPSLLAVGWTFLSALLKSYWIMLTISSRYLNLVTASTAASLHKAFKSEATKPGVILDNS